MFEPTKSKTQKLKTLAASLAAAAAANLYCHRAIYAGLALCHGSGCFVTEKPALYGPMALLYALLALKG